MQVVQYYHKQSYGYMDTNTINKWERGEIIKKFDWKSLSKQKIKKGVGNCMP
jgi:hypothetical protein